MSVYDELVVRGFVKQVTHEDDLRRLFASGKKVTYYIGFDPTAESLHVGSLVPIMAMAHLQRAGHSPIVILGGGTAMIGDPSGKTETRRIMSREEIVKNGKGIAAQIGRYLKLDGKAGRAVDNGDWLLDLTLIDFLRDIGSRFRVNEMIKAEGYKQRLEREDGLSLLEFFYQTLQAYDFLVLFDKYGCELQMGGDDQWGNILAGVDLVRRMRGKKETGQGGKKQGSFVFGLTFPLIVTATGGKMGKTEKGVVWIDEKKTSAYELYQYWINTDDRDVERFLKLFTFLPLEEIEEVASGDIRKAKEILAYEATALCHGREAAKRARETSRLAFGGEAIDSVDLPTVKIPKSLFNKGMNVLDFLVVSGLVKSKSEARRLIQQGGAYLNESQVTDEGLLVTNESLKDGALVLRKGKKQYVRVEIF